MVSLSRVIYLVSAVAGVDPWLFCDVCIEDVACCKLVLLELLVLSLDIASLMAEIVKSWKVISQVGVSYSLRGQTSLTSLRALTYDPIIGSCDLIEQTIPACSFVKANNIILNLNQSFLNDLRRSVRHAVMHR